jgi:hypothetical protein
MEYLRTRGTRPVGNDGAVAKKEPP